MKKKILVLTSALTLTICSLFAAPVTDVPTNIVNELHNNFKSVHDVQWQTTDKFYKATFTSNGLILQAFYGTDGIFLGVSRNVTADQLPLPLSLETSEKSSTGKITDLFELSSNNGTEYYMTIQTAKKIINYKSNGNDWSIFDVNTSKY